MASVDASNCCIPPRAPLVACCPPLPSPTRGEPLVLDGRPGHLNSDSTLLTYASGRLVVVRDLGSNGEVKANQAFIYRGHAAAVTAVKFSPSGCYVASADARGKLRVWSFDNEEHLAKLDITAMVGPIRDIAWDFESKRLAFVGEASANSDCGKVISWDTANSLGSLGQHTRGRSVSCAFKPSRPMRVVTAGKDDSKLLFNAGPPFKRVVDGVPDESQHTKNAVNCVRYNHSGSRVVSVGADKSIHVYDGKTLQTQASIQDLHDGTIYACAWSSDDKFILTCSADGTVKLTEVLIDSNATATQLTLVHTWNVAHQELSKSLVKVPIGGMQMGCAFVKDDVPVSVGLNGNIIILPKPPVLNGTDAPDKYTFLTGHTAPISGLAIDHDRHLLYTGDTDGVLCQWDVKTGKVLTRFKNDDSADENSNDDLLAKIHTGAVSCLTVSADSGTVLSAGWDDILRKSTKDAIVEHTGEKLPAQPNAMATGTNLVVVMTVDGLLLVNGSDGTILSADLIKLDNYEALSVCMSSDDSTVYVGGNDCNIYVYKVTASHGLEEIHVIEGAHLKPVHALELSNAGSLLASADVRDVCVFSLSDNYSVLVGKGRWCFHTQRITCLSWSPDDSMLGSGGADDSIYIWCLAKKTKRVHYNHTHRGGVTGLEFIRNVGNDDGGYKLVSVGGDSCVNQWDVTNDVAQKFG